MLVKTCPDSPRIGNEIELIIGSIPGNVDNFVLSLQLDYRDHNTIFYLNRVNLIEFTKDMLHISQEKNSHIFISYENIKEYAVINSEDVIDMGLM